MRPAAESAPDLPQAILLRSRIAASKKRWGDAINDMQVLLQTDPTNDEFRIQLAGYYVGDSRRVRRSSC